MNMTTDRQEVEHLEVWYKESNHAHQHQDDPEDDNGLQEGQTPAHTDSTAQLRISSESGAQFQGLGYTSDDLT